MPVLMRPQRLHESRPFFGRGSALAIEASRVFEDAIRTGGTDGHDVVVEHHERQPTVAFQGMAVMVVQDRLLLPGFQPKIAGNLAVVLIGLAVAIFPVVELAGTEFQPAEKLAGWQFGTHGPVFDVIDNLVASVVGNPNSL